MGRFKNEKFANFKRRAILDAAAAEFAEKGADKASMRAIAAAAGMTTGAIYTMFDGKEDIYAALLHESLSRLNRYVAEKTEAAESPEEAVRASIMAFFDYYIDRLFEVQLGMHSFSGFNHGSLGRDRDERLNAALIETLDIFARTISEFAKTLSADEVLAERDAIFSCLMGALSLAHTGRAESIGTTPEKIMQTHLNGLIRRLS
ncbi:TetR family transcriptional regulator [Sneathiella sp. P13V-1]|uniref:TetR/AcrR family transcriptional regulator n=1 Tax=Sneathiella sp. P13V-1 TaxID=2697366 RepID=UPI00187BAB83|nr:TetR/AcrR family transcriptional regulator [Sneathiella sp. P13V-1]MBE7638022.1 TetR family transcriptional regulator [Sneathiella sp. P13V-1]